jgi:hypothetical protein
MGDIELLESCEVALRPHVLTYVAQQLGDAELDVKLFPKAQYAAVVVRTPIDCSAAELESRAVLSSKQAPRVAARQSIRT